MTRPTLVRDGTIFGAGSTEIDLRTPDYSVWVTIKGDADEDVERVVSALLAAFPESANSQDEPHDVFCDHGNESECPVHGDDEHRVKGGALSRPRSEGSQPGSGA